MLTKCFKINQISTNRNKNNNLGVGWRKKTSSNLLNSNFSMDFTVSQTPNRASLVAQLSRSHLPSRRCRLNPWVRKIPWRRKWQHTPDFLPGRTYRQRNMGTEEPHGYSPQARKVQYIAQRLKSKTINNRKCFFPTDNSNK